MSDLKKEIIDIIMPDQLDPLHGRKFTPHQVVLTNPKKTVDVLLELFEKELNFRTNDYDEK